MTPDEMLRMFISDYDVSPRTAKDYLNRARWDYAAACELFCNEN